MWQMQSNKFKLLCRVAADFIRHLSPGHYWTKLEPSSAEVVERVLSACLDIRVNERILWPWGNGTLGPLPWIPLTVDKDEK
jgi:hypothetical protein